MQYRICILLLAFCSSFVISLESLDVGCVQENQCKDFPSYCCPQGYCCNFWTHTRRNSVEIHLSSRCVLLTEMNDEQKLCEQKHTVPAHKAQDFNEPVEKRKCTEYDKMMGYYCIDGVKTKRESVTGDPFMWMQQEMGVQNKMVLDAMLKKRKPKNLRYFLNAHHFLKQTQIDVVISSSHFFRVASGIYGHPGPNLDGLEKQSMEVCTQRRSILHTMLEITTNQRIQASHASGKVGACLVTINDLVALRHIK